MKLSNLEMTEESINVQENDKDVQENDMLLAEVRRQVNPISFCACTHFVQRIQITPHRTSAEERGKTPSCFMLQSATATKMFFFLAFLNVNSFNMSIMIQRICI